MARHWPCTPWNAMTSTCLLSETIERDSSGVVSWHFPSHPAPPCAHCDSLISTQNSKWNHTLSGNCCLLISKILLWLNHGPSPGGPCSENRKAQMHLMPFRDGQQRKTWREEPFPAPESRHGNWGRCLAFKQQRTRLLDFTFSVWGKGATKTCNLSGQCDQCPWLFCKTEYSKFHWTQIFNCNLSFHVCMDEKKRTSFVVNSLARVNLNKILIAASRLWSYTCIQEISVNS